MMLIRFIGLNQIRTYKSYCWRKRCSKVNFIRGISGKYCVHFFLFYIIDLTSLTLMSVKFFQDLDKTLITIRKWTKQMPLLKINFKNMILCLLSSITDSSHPHYVEAVNLKYRTMSI